MYLCPLCAPRKSPHRDNGSHKSPHREYDQTPGVDILPYASPGGRWEICLIWEENGPGDQFWQGGGGNFGKKVGNLDRGEVGFVELYLPLSNTLRTQHH